MRWKIYTKKATVYSENAIKLGYLSYEHTGKSWEWCWYQEEIIRMSPKNLREVTKMQRRLTKIKPVQNPTKARCKK